MTPTDRKIEIMNRTYSSNVQRLTNEVIELKIEKERAIKELKEVETMTRHYQQYLVTEGKGGDWTLSKFMQNLNDTTIKSRVILEKE